jgi:hypothetical protein
VRGSSKHGGTGGQLARARAERRCDAMKARIMAKIERLDDYTISQE